MLLQAYHFAALVSDKSCSYLLVVARASRGLVARNEPLLVYHVDLTLTVGLVYGGTCLLRLVRHYAHFIGLLQDALARN